MADFLWPPTWRSGGVVERIEWLTDVQQSSNGTEVRRSLREKPRTSISFEVAVEGVEAVKLKNFIKSNQGKIVSIPWWIGGIEFVGTTIGMLGLPSKLGITSTYQLGYGPNGSRVLITKDGNQWVRPTSTSNGVAITVSTANWPLAGPERPGAFLYPMIDCYMSSTQQLEAPTAGVVRFQVTFDVVNPIEYGEQTTPTQHNSIPVFTDEPNRREDVSLEYQRLVQELDFGTGKRSFADRSWQSFRLVSHEYNYEGISEITGFKSLLNGFKGRRDELYLPSFECDFPEPSINFGYVPTRITHTDVGYRFLYPRPEAVVITLQKGGVICKNVINSVATTQNREFTNIDTVIWPDDLLKTVQILHRSRLNTDSVEIVWENSQVATVTLPFRSIRRT